MIEFDNFKEFFKKRAGDSKNIDMVDRIDPELFEYVYCTMSPEEKYWFTAKSTSDFDDVVKYGVFTKCLCRYWDAEHGVTTYDAESNRVVYSEKSSIYELPLPINALIELQTHGLHTIEKLNKFLDGGGIGDLTETTVQALVGMANMNEED